MSLQAFQPNRDVPVLNADGTMNPQWDAYFNLLKVNSNNSVGGNEEALGAIYGTLSPLISNLGAQVFQQNKDVQDLVAEIEGEKASSANARAFLAECKKAIACNEALIMQLLATVGGLNAQLAEATKARLIQAKAATYQMLNNDLGVNADASGGAFDVTLPDPVKNTGKTYFLSNTGGNGNVTWLPFASETLGGQPSLVVPSSIPSTTIEVTSDGTNYLMS